MKRQRQNDRLETTKPSNKKIKPEKKGTSMVYNFETKQAHQINVPFLRRNLPNTKLYFESQ